MSNGYGKQNAGFNISREQSIDLIVQTCLDNQVTDPHQIAYVLATAQHESKDFTAPEEAWGRKQGLEKRYAGGEEYYGRGYVHLTHEFNYADLGQRLGLGRQLVDHPERAAEPEMAAKVMVVGMRDGAFTTVGLDRYINEQGADYTGARAIVNGSDQAGHIAELARAWETHIPGLVERVQREGVQLQPLSMAVCAPRDLKQGDSNQDVFEAQQYLARLGIQADGQHEIVADGDFGPRMSQAVRTYEQSIGIEKPTGHVDETLFERLRSDTLALDPQFQRRSYTDLHGPLADGKLKPGEMGEPVYEMRLQLEATGYLTRDPQLSLQKLRTYDTPMQHGIEALHKTEKLAIGSGGEVSRVARERLNTRAIEAGAAPTTEFDRAEDWPPQRPPYTRAEYQPQQTQDLQHARAAPDSPAAARAPQASVLSDPAHPGFPEFQHNLRHVQSMEEGQRIASGPHSEQVTAALMVEAERHGLRGGLTQVRMGEGGQIVGVQRVDAFAPERVVGIDSGQAISVPLETHSAQWLAARSPHLVSDAPAAIRTAEQAAGRSQLSSADQAIFDRIRQDTPVHISDDHVGLAMLGAKRDELHDVDKLSRVAMVGDQLWVVGKTEGFRSMTDVSQPAPALQDSIQQAHTINQQRELAQQQDMTRSQNQGGNGAPVMG